MQLPDFELERYFARYEFDVEYLLCCSDCESTTVDDLLSWEPLARHRLDNLWLGYTESQGNPALRLQISRMYETIAPEQVLVHSGAEEAIFLFMHALLRPGDHLIVHTPCYQSLRAVPASIGCQITPWRARESSGWALDVDELRDLIRPETRAIVLNLPHNPTGYLMCRERFSEVVDIARSRGIVVFSDEVYRESEYSSRDRLPAACDLDARAVSLGVMSKSYGLAGLRIGWVATRNRDVYNRMASLKDYTTICNSAPSEFLAELALRHRKRLTDRNVGIIARNITLLDDFFRRHSEIFTWQPPKAGPVAFPRFLQGDTVSFCERLVKEAGVLLLPGTVFDDSGEHFRIGFGRKNLPDALQRLEQYLGA